MSVSAIPTVQVDSETVRVTEWRFPPGTATGWHRHEMAYVVVPMTDGVLTLVDKNGARTQGRITRGVSYSRPLGTEHDVVNETESEIVFIEVEIKG